MKLTFFISSALVALSVMSQAGVLASPASPPARSADSQDGNAFMEQSVGIMCPLNDRMSVDTLYGYTTGRGYQFSKTERGSHDLFFMTGWFRGTQSVHGGDFTMHLSQELLPFYAGYRYTRLLSEQWSAYLGVHAGYVYSHSTQKTSGIEDDGPFAQKLSTSSNSFACGVSAGVTWRFARNWAATAGYSFTEMLPMKRFTDDDSYPKSSSAPAGTAHIGLTMIFGDTPALLAREKKAVWLYSGSLGMMNSNRGFVNNGDQWVTSDLYGGQLAIARELSSHGKWAQRVGFSTGYYYGDVTNRYGYDEPVDGGIRASQYSVHNEVNVVPLLATWDWVYALRPSFALRAGLVAGAIVRHSDFDLELSEEFTSLQGESERASTSVHSSSTRILPTVGLRLGVEVRMNERSLMFIGYDYMQSFGKDSKTPHDPTGLFSEECGMVPKRNRYFGLVTAGVCYAF